MENMYIYSALASTPQEARKSITAGRLKGFTDINPMWRIKRLTELFGPCGIGWYYEPVKVQFVPGASGEIACFVDINLFYKADDGWSKPVPGSGGSMLVASERNGLHTSDEAIKMATTDAIGSACKLMGMSADIYFDKDRTKYTVPEPEQPKLICSCCGQPIQGVQLKGGRKYSPDDLYKKSIETYHTPMCWNCMKEAAKNVGTENQRNEA